MEDTKTIVRVSMDIALAPTQAFDVFIEELVLALAQAGMSFDAGTNGRMTEGEFEVGRVITWQPGELIRLRWHQADWQTDEVTEIEVRFEKIDGSTRVTVEHRGWGGLIGDPGELVGWFASSVAAPLLQVTAPSGFENWLIDRKARRAGKRPCDARNASRSRTNGFTLALLQ